MQKLHFGALQELIVNAEIFVKGERGSRKQLEGYVGAIIFACCPGL